MPDEKDEVKTHYWVEHAGDTVPVEPDKTVIRALGFGDMLGGGLPAAIDVKQ